MKHIRIGKDISMRWSILTDGAAIPLQGRDLTLELKSPIGKVIILPFRIEGHVLTITYYGYEQTVVGEYSLTLWENKGKQGQNVVDAISAFKLVRTSPEEEDFIGGDLQVESVDLGTANLEILSGGGSATPGESPDLSALEGKVAANTSSISKIKADLDTIKYEQTEQNNSISQINTTLEEHSERIAENASEIERVNNVVESHEERLVYTESDLVKVRAEYNSIISELVKSIAHTQKAFVVETNDSEGVISIDNVKTIIPPNSRKGFIFQHGWNNGNSGIASFRFLVTNTSSFNNMSYMFKGCSSLTSLDVSNFDTSKATSMYDMFNGCSSLTSLDVSNFDTSLVTNFGAMFGFCASLTSLDVSNFDTSKATSMYGMFNGCSSLTSLDVSKFDTSLVTNMNSMFAACESLTSLDLSNFDTSSATGIGSTFIRCYSLTSLLLGPNFFKTAAVTIIDFSYCSKWTNETVVTSLVANSYDRAAAGLNTLTIKLHANTKAALSDEQKATITSKGYTIA